MTAMAKKAVGIIQDDEFMGGEFFDGKDWAALAVKDLDNLGAKFVKDFKEGPAALVVADLADDGATFEKLWLVTLGKVFNTREKTFKCSKLWNFKETVSIKFEPLELSKFDFSRGYMYSEPLDGSKVEHSFVNDKGEKVALADLTTQGYDGFTLRCVVAPTTTAHAKLHMYIYPCNKTKLASTHEWSTKIEYPGMAVTSVLMDLGVQQSRVTKKSTGCPILPVVRTDIAMEKAKRVPAMGEVGYKVAVLFNRVTLPETKTTMKSLWERMAAIKEHGAALLEGAAPDKMWPSPSDLAGNPGEHL